MRRADGYPPGDLRLYVPEAYGNRDDRDPVGIWIRQPTERDKRAIYAIGDKVIVDEDGKPRIETTAGAQMDRSEAAIRRCVEKVDNYSAVGKAILTGEDFATHAEPLIFVEVANEILMSLSFSDAQRKKSEGSPATFSAATPVSGGCALTVAPPGFASVAGPDGYTLSKPPVVL